MPNIAFVNDEDEIIGSGTKEEAWKNGNIHRIVRILIFNSRGELLIQKRAPNVAIWPDRWDHSVGGHVDEGEDYLTAAKREAREELGIDSIELVEVEKYFADEIHKDGKIKKRFNMLYKANYDGPVSLNKEEVTEIKWVLLDKLDDLIIEKPENFTDSLLVCLGLYKKAK